MTEQKNGLVLQGGAMRGIYTAGVLDVFLEQNIAFDGVIGVSAGAVHGATYVARQPGRNIRYFMQYCRDPRFMSVRSWLKTGDIFNVEFGYHEIPERLDPLDNDAFMQNPTKFYVTCTNVETATPLYHRCHSVHGTDLEYLRASASMPIAARIVEVEGKKLLDGGISDNVPDAYFQSIGYNRRVIVLTQPAGYRKTPGSAKIYSLAYGKKYPALVAALSMRAESYNAEMDAIDAAEKAGEVLVIRPTEDLHIAHTEHDPARLHAQYALGRRNAFARIDEVRAWLKKETT